MHNPHCALLSPRRQGADAREGGESVGGMEGLTLGPTMVDLLRVRGKRSAGDVAGSAAAWGDGATEDGSPGGFDAGIGAETLFPPKSFTGDRTDCDVP